jgi:tetraacyldisaccharide 4'-kinase
MDLPLPVRLLLWPLAQLYGFFVRAKAALYASGFLRQRRLKGKVLSVGNLTTGGTGKTPMVLRLAERFAAKGKSVAILSRGYRGSQGGSDEVNLLRRRLGTRVRFGIGADRFEQGSALERDAPVDLFLLDDGFQHLRLARDVDIVMLDGSRRLKDEWLLPAGRLREPVAACSRADLFVVTRQFEKPPLEAGDLRGRPIFRAQTRLRGFRRWNGGDDGISSLGQLGPGPFFAFCGIGNPEGFAEDLKRWGVSVSGTRAFSDHHRYSQGDIDAIEQAAAAEGSLRLITTEKDEQNLGGEFRLPLYVAVIDLAVGAESEFDASLEGLLGRGGRPR